MKHPFYPHLEFSQKSLLIVGIQLVHVLLEVLTADRLASRKCSHHISVVKFLCRQKEVVDTVIWKLLMFFEIFHDTNFNVILISEVSTFNCRDNRCEMFFKPLILGKFDAYENILLTKNSQITVQNRQLHVNKATRHKRTWETSRAHSKQFQK